MDLLRIWILLSDSFATEQISALKGRVAIIEDFYYYLVRLKMITKFSALTHLNLPINLPAKWRWDLLSLPALKEGQGGCNAVQKRMIIFICQVELFCRNLFRHRENPGNNSTNFFSSGPYKLFKVDSLSL